MIENNPARYKLPQKLQKAARRFQHTRTNHVPSSQDTENWYWGATKLGSDMVICLSSKNKERKKTGQHVKVLYLVEMELETFISRHAAKFRSSELYKACCSAVPALQLFCNTVGGSSGLPPNRTPVVSSTSGLPPCFILTLVPLRCPPSTRFNRMS